MPARQCVCYSARMRVGPFIRAVAVVLLISALATVAASQPGGPTTESNCNFGMGKDEPRQSCEIPMIEGCAVAQFPGSTKPWSSISKGGNTTCRFEDKKTDWKTRITGACTRCKSQHCSARFSVMFSCDAAPPSR